MLKDLLGWLVLGLACSLLVPTAAVACAQPPVVQQPDPVFSAAECRLLFPDPVMVANEPFRVEITVVNLGSEDGQPPFWNDQDAFIVPTVTRGSCTDNGAEVPVQPGEGWLFLDDSADPDADQRTSGTLTFVVLPPPAASPGPYVVSFQVQKGRDGDEGISCEVSECIELVAPVTVQNKPTVEFLQPVSGAAPGEAVPFDLLLKRNGYPLNVPLTVRVIPSNSADPVDIFPIEPEGLSTTGTVLRGEDEHLVSFSCRVHGPCYVGVSNEYHVTIHAGEELLCDTRWDRPTGIARVLVEEAPLANWWLTEILDEEGNGQLAACEPGQLRLRAAARNPWRTSTMTDTVLELPLPEGLVLLDYQVHFHDNPMDDIDPTPAQLSPGETVTLTADRLIVEIGDLEPREVPGAPGPAWFTDLVDVDLLFELPPEGPGDILGLQGPTVTGVALGTPRFGSAAAIVIEAVPTPPIEVAAAGASEPLLYDPEGGRWTWGAGLSGAGSFDVHRGKLASLFDRQHGDCLVTGLTEGVLADQGEPGESGWFYLVSGRNCGGIGPVGSASDGIARVPETACP